MCHYLSSQEKGKKHGSKMSENLPTRNNVKVSGREGSKVLMFAHGFGCFVGVAFAASDLEVFFV